MKITKEYLKRVISEELGRLNENEEDEFTEAGQQAFAGLKRANAEGYMSAIAKTLRKGNNDQLVSVAGREQDYRLPKEIMRDPDIRSSFKTTLLAMCTKLGAWIPGFENELDSFKKKNPHLVPKQ